MPSLGMLSGNVWHDADHHTAPGGLDACLKARLVELLFQDQPVRSMMTDVDGNYRFVVRHATSSAPGETYSAV